MKARIIVLICAAALLLGAGSHTVAWATSTYSDDLGLEYPEQGDIGWDDAIRLNYKILEALQAAAKAGHLVVTGATPTAGATGLQVSWAAGTVKMAGKAYSLAAGTTTFVNNTVNFLSAVTIVGSSGATIDLRSTEYNPPSGASGYFVPLAVGWTESGTVSRLRDIRHMPESRYNMDQDVGTDDDVRHNSIYVVDLTDAARGNFRSGVSIPSGTSPGTLPSGGLYVDTNDNLLQVGGSGAELEKVYDITISSPDLLDNPSAIPLFTIPSGATFYVTGVTFFTDTSGVSVEGIAYSASETNMRFGSGSTLFNYTALNVAGTDLYSKSFSGVSAIPGGRTVMMDYGHAAPGYIRVRFTGRLVGARP